MTVIDAKVLVRRRGRVVLGPISMRFEPGITVVAGENGAGKTTLALALAGAIRFEGAVEINGDRSDRRRLHVARLPQSPSGLDHLSLSGALSYVATLRRVEVVPARLMESAGLERLARAKLRSMSGGERQRAYVLASTVGSPDLLILDEPTVGVDAEHRLAIHEMLRLCPARHVIVTSHLPDDLAALGADRTVVLAAGRVAFDGPVAELEATVGPDPAHSRIDRALVAVARGSAAA